MEKDEIIEFSDLQSGNSSPKKTSGLSWSEAIKLLSPKAAFVGGLSLALLGLTTVGFFLLLPLEIRNLTGQLSASAAPVAQLTAPAVAPQQPAAAPSPVNVGVGHFPAKGNANAKVTVIEFADFRCPFCERFYNAAEKSIIKDYVASGKVKFYFRGFAFLGPASTVASEAAECANEQGQFWKFHDWMYEHQAQESDTAYYSKDNLIKYAVNLGLNSSKFASCLNSDKYASAVGQDLSEGQQAGVNGTPTTFVNGAPIVGAVPYEQVKAAIDAQLK